MLFTSPSVTAGAETSSRISVTVCESLRRTARFAVRSSIVACVMFGTAAVAQADTFDTPGVVRSGVWYLNNNFDSTAEVGPFSYGDASDKATAGDWNGDGVDTPGVVRPVGTSYVWYLNNGFDQTSDIPEFSYGSADDIAVVGDWNGDGIDTPGIVRPVGTSYVWYLNNDFDQTSDIPEFSYGSADDIAVVGDWNGDGIDTPGVVRPVGTSYVWYLNNGFDQTPDIPEFSYGSADDIAVVGDWNGDATMTPGIFRGGEWYLNNGFDQSADIGTFTFGQSGDMPVSGNWEGVSFCYGQTTSASRCARRANNFGGKTLEGSFSVGYRGVRSNIRPPDTPWQLDHNHAAAVRVVAQSGQSGAGLIQIGMAQIIDGDVGECEARANRTAFWEYHIENINAPFHCAWLDNTVIPAYPTSLLYSVYRKLASATASETTWQGNIEGSQKLVVDTQFDTAGLVGATGELVRIAAVQFGYATGGITACFGCSARPNGQLIGWQKTTVAGSTSWTNVTEGSRDINSDSKWQIGPSPSSFFIGHPYSAP